MKSPLCGINHSELHDVAVPFVLQTVLPSVMQPMAEQFILCSQFFKLSLEFVYPLAQFCHTTIRLTVFVHVR